MTTGLPDFFNYNLWANRLLLDACEQLSDAQLDTTMIGIYGSVRETLMHLFSAEEGYARSLTGTSPSPLLKELASFPGFDVLRQRAESSGETLAKAAEQRDLDRVLHLDGGTYDAPAIIVVMQAIQHAIDHRSQIATLLSQLNIELPDLSAWSYNDATFNGSYKGAHLPGSSHLSS